MRRDMIGPTVHHIDSRQSCAGCGTRVFTYADEIDDTAARVHQLRKMDLIGQAVTKSAAE